MLKLGMPGNLFFNPKKAFARCLDAFRFISEQNWSAGRALRVSEYRHTPIMNMAIFVQNHMRVWSYGATCKNPCKDRPSRSCPPPQPQCSLAQEKAGGRRGKVSPDGAMRCANLGESRARWATAPSPRCAEVPSGRTRASRAKVAIFAHQATLPNKDYHTEKSVLFPQIDRLDGFRAKRADTAFRQKTRRNISRLQRRETGNHTPHSKPITRMPMRVSNQVFE